MVLLAGQPLRALTVRIAVSVRGDYLRNAEPNVMDQYGVARERLVVSRLASNFDRVVRVARRDPGEQVAIVRWQCGGHDHSALEAALCRRPSTMRRNPANGVLVLCDRVDGQPSVRRFPAQVAPTHHVPFRVVLAPVAAGGVGPSERVPHLVRQHCTCRGMTRTEPRHAP